ncbi:hypothetical protein VNI00_011806 [Paramarasmius palmivorus]|uniref:F-box domain-containing protein n=1 Tax=Paramarasmius palmivorus TaxID=297713 RepID=A0AAW0C985_9AGAR
MNTLPVELLYEIQLWARSPALPQVNRRFHQIFSSSPPSYKAQYLYHVDDPLRYPIACDEKVLPLLPAPDRSPDLPRHLFRHLSPGKKYDKSHHPLPLLNFLYNNSSYPPNANAHSGYALTKAVHAGFLPLVQFLLFHGASPAHKNGLVVTIAIRQRNLHMVKILVEPQQKGNKKRKVEDRVKISPEMLRTAVKCKAKDIVDYFTQEKGCVPDMQTLYAL